MKGCAYSMQDKSPPQPSTFVALIALCFSFEMAIMDVTIVNVALPNLAQPREFN